MSPPLSTAFKLGVFDGVTVTVKVDQAANRETGAPFLILAHGANNDLDFPLLAYLAHRLGELVGITIVRFNFPYVERGVTSPDPRPVLEETFARLYEHVTSRLADPGAAVFIGGKSLGGRTAAELVSRGAEGAGLAAKGLIVLGYPLHAAGHKERLLLSPLRHIDIPSLFCIGSRDPLCDPRLLEPVLAGLTNPGAMFVVKGGDHSLHLPHSKGGRPEDSYEPVAQVIAAFVSEGLSAT